MVASPRSLLEAQFRSIAGIRGSGVTGALSLPLRLLEQSRIIPAVRKPELLTLAISAPSKIVFFLCGTPDNIEGMVQQVITSTKVPIVNLDLVGGLSRNGDAIKYLARRQVYGIISTHSEALRAARSAGLLAIQRTFLLDSAALDSTLRSLSQFLPDALEILPAMAGPRIVEKLHGGYPELPVLAGGLVRTLREIEDLIAQGIGAISVSDPRLWVA